MPKVRSFRKPSITRSILKKIAELGEATLDGFFPPQYPEARLTRDFLGLDSNRVITRRSFSSLIVRLQKQGLVARSGIARHTRWTLTDNGKAVIKKLENRVSGMSKDGISRLVIFDIPEQERKKRTALRTELLAMGFRPLQKSVWIGFCPLSEDFLETLDMLELAKYVHIFSVRHEGTINLPHES